MSSWSSNGSPYYDHEYAGMRRSQNTNLGHRRGKDYDFVELAHTLHKGVNAWSFYDIDIVILPIDLDGYRKVCLR